MSEKQNFVLGQRVKHKSMSGIFVIRREHSDDKNRRISTRPQPDYEIRGSDGNVFDVFSHELTKE